MVFSRYHCYCCTTQGVADVALHDDVKSLIEMQKVWGLLIHLNWKCEKGKFVITEAKILHH